MPIEMRAPLQCICFNALHLSPLYLAFLLLSLGTLKFRLLVALLNLNSGFDIWRAEIQWVPQMYIAYNIFCPYCDSNIVG